MAQYYSSTRFRPECPTCGTGIGQLEESYKRLLEQKKTPSDALDALGVTKPCCRARAVWSVVLPVGAFYLPHHEAGMLNYLGLKEPAPQPNLVVMSLRKAANGEHFIVSHVDKDGFIGKFEETGRGGITYHDPMEMVISNPGDQRRIVVKEGTELKNECEVRVQTEPGEITRSFPFETRAFRRDIEVDKVRSYFDLAPPEEEQGRHGEEGGVYEEISAAPTVPLEALGDFNDGGGEDDEPLMAAD